MQRMSVETPFSQYIAGRLVPTKMAAFIVVSAVWCGSGGHHRWGWSG